MSILDLESLEQTPLRSESCDYVVVPRFVRPEFLADVRRDYPRIAGPGSFDADETQSGPAFQKLIGSLRSESLAAAFSRKFGVELGSLPLQIGIRRFAQASDGHIHNDSRSKYVTALIYFNESWSQPGGRLRFLRRPDDIDSHFVEVDPCGGTLVAFRRSEHSYHGFVPCEGERLSLQMYWVSPKRAARGGPKKGFDPLRKLKRFLKRG